MGRALVRKGDRGSVFGIDGGADRLRPEPPSVDLLQAIDQENTKLVRDHMEHGTDPAEMFIPIGFPFAGA